MTGFKSKAKKALKAVKEDEFFTYKNPLIPIALVIIIVWLIEKLVTK